MILEETFERHALTPDKARAYLGGAQNDIADDTFTKVLLATESYDPADNFDGYKYTVARDGYYDIKGMVTWLEASVIADKLYIGAIYVNGTVALRTACHSTAVKQLSCPVSDTRFLEAADYIELFCYHNAGVGTVDLQPGSEFTFLAVHLISE